MISLLLFFALKNILVLFAKPDSGELHCPATAFIILTGNEDYGMPNVALFDIFIFLSDLTSLLLYILGFVFNS